MENEKGIAFLVVGHSNWGKSQTLRVLTDGDYKRRTVTIDGADFFVRKMSNDDDRNGHPPFLDFAKALRPANRPRVIAAFCPTFGEGESGLKILETLRKRYDLFFFVLRHRYNGSEQITEREIATLREVGEVKVFTKRAEADERGRVLLRFIRENAKVFQTA